MVYNKNDIFSTEKIKETSYMNKWLTQLITNRENFFNAICIIVYAVWAILSGYTNQALTVVIFSTIFFALIDWGEKLGSGKFIQKMLNCLLRINKAIIFLILYGIALLPMVVGYAEGEITFTGIEGFIKMIFSNPVQNCLGATIIYSFIKHLSKFDIQEVTDVVVQERKDFFNIILKFAFMASVINATTYKIGSNLNKTNFFNSIHLFIVVFLGIVLLCIFFLRLISKQPINLTVIQMYPSWVLFFGFAFLASCSLPSIIWENAESEVILFSGNTVLALVVIWFMFFIVKRRCTVREDDYPLFPPIAFSIFAIANWIINIIFGNEKSNKIAQLISVGGIYLCVIVLLLFIDNKSKVSDTD